MTWTEKQALLLQQFQITSTAIAILWIITAMLENTHNHNKVV